MSRYPCVEFPQFIRETMSQWSTPGVGVAVVSDQDIVFCEGFGMRSVRESLPVTPETIFPIASATKAFTALCIGILCEEGRLGWDIPVRQYIPHFEMYDPFVTLQLTPRDMACHRSGLARHDLMWYKNSSCSRGDIVRRLRYLQPNTGFRTTWQYSNLMYTALGYLIESVSNMSWEDFVRERILSPLAMMHTTTSNKLSQGTGDFARPYRENGSQLLEVPFYPLDFEPTGPAGAIKSSVLDLANWLLIHLNSGKFRNTQLFSLATIEELQTPHIPCNLNPWESHRIPVQMYGLGWFIEPFRSSTVIHHGGHIDGFSSLVSFMPDVNVGVVVLANKDNVPVPEIVTRFVYDKYLGFDMDWNSFFKTKQRTAVEEAHHFASAHRSNHKSNTCPSHDLLSYVGEYDHAGYGRVSITYNGVSLILRYNDLSFPLSHFHYDAFEFIYAPFQLHRTASFQTGTHGNIESISIQMESAAGVDPIVFRRRLTSEQA